MLAGLARLTYGAAFQHSELIGSRSSEEAWSFRKPAAVLLAGK
jgi:hypothetical protein